MNPMPKLPWHGPTPVPKSSDMEPLASAPVRCRKSTQEELSLLPGRQPAAGKFRRLILLGSSVYEVMRLTGLPKKQVWFYASCYGLRDMLYRNSYSRRTAYTVQ